MQYFKINGVDFSKYVSALKVGKTANYTSQVNANGDSVVDYINTKRALEVGIIPLNQEAMINLQNVIDNFNVTVSFLNPSTGLVESIDAIIPTDEIEYYTIQNNNVFFKAYNIKIMEL